MIYKKLSIYFKEARDRFNRVILVDEDMDLVELGCTILTALKATFEHSFLFVAKGKDYVSDIFMEDPLESYVPMKEYHLSDLGKKFDFEYDTGDGWVFEVIVDDKDVEVNSDLPAHFVDGKGQGLWEDNMYTLCAYLDGRVGPAIKDEDEEKGYYRPWNFTIDKYSDFDKALDLKEEREEFNQMQGINYEAYLEAEEEYALGEEY